MSWNYRVCQYTANGTVLFGIREVYYNADGTVKTARPPSVDDWESVDDVARTLELMRQAMSQPVLVVEQQRIERTNANGERNQPGVDH
jgi:hypothetical protein